jgi:hypothetical protein
MPWTKSPAKQRRAPLSNEEPARRKTDAKHGTCAYICALDREICQVEKDRELGCQTVGDGFFSFCQKKIWMGKTFVKLLEMLANSY